MGYYTGAAKYLVMGLWYNPFNLYIYGGGLLWFLDVFQLVGSDNANEFALNYILVTYGIPSSLGDAVTQLLVGAIVATIRWLAGSLQYSRRQGWT